MPTDLLTVQVWTMPLAGVTEADSEAFDAVLSPAEKARRARFHFARNRIEYSAAHALTRAVLSSLINIPPRIWSFADDQNGKPVAMIDSEPAPISFNLSHTDGMVGVAAVACPGIDIGFDLEPASRPVELGIARRYFCPPEIDWLQSQPPAKQGVGFLRLWTLKEAYIKATGEGLSADLASFWFDPDCARVHDGTDTSWHFEQRLFDDGFIAAIGYRARQSRYDINWTTCRLSAA